MKQAFGQEELHQREAVCTREEPPGCQAACPLHLDMRAVCGHEARGDFKKAAAVIRQTTPFLYLLARTCSAPCQKACTLSRLGEGVRVRDLELACALYGGPAGGSRFLIPRKNKKVLVAGDGIFALACCRELGKKGYEVHWHTACASFQAPLLELGLSRKRRRRICRNFLLCGSPGKRRRNFSEKPWRTGAAGRTPSACPRSLCLADCRKTDLPDRRERKRSGSWRPPGTRPCRRTAIFRGLPRRGWRNQRYTKAASM